MHLKPEQKQWAEATWAKLDKKLRAVNKQPMLPYMLDENGKYIDMTEKRRDWWTNGFHHAMLLLMYDATGYEPYLRLAEGAMELLEPALLDPVKMNHDVGFMWHITNGLHYKITGDEHSRQVALRAADRLMARFNCAGGFIQAWNKTWQGIPCQGFTIIDCMMNIPLLHWAQRETEMVRYGHVARAHAEKTIRDHIRPDGSARHIVDHDVNTGAVIGEYGGQGYAEGSAWTRGQGWCIYGFALSYRHTKEQKHLDIAKAAAQYFLDHLPEDGLVPCDFDQPAEPKYYDDSAAMIAACGMLEIALHSEGEEKRKWQDAAFRLVKAHVDALANWDENVDAVMCYGTVAYHFGEQNVHLVYTDYYLTEALYRLTGHDREIW